MTQSLTLESPVVREAKRKFEKSRVARRYNILFDDWFVRFKRGDTYFSIGKPYGLDGQRVCVFRKKYFEAVLPRTGGEERRRRVRRENSVTSHALELQLPETSKLREAARLARAAKCRVEFIPTAVPGKQQVDRSRIRVDGVLCFVHRSKNPRYPGINIHKETNTLARAHICLNAATKNTAVYIVPTSWLTTTLSRPSDKTRPEVYVPFPFRHSCPKRGICICGCRNGWWILKTLE